MTDSDGPGLVVAAGDWHGNTPWALHVLDRAARLLAGEPVKRVLHAGDFGVWPGRAGDAYIDAVIGTCFAHGIRLWFVDGNHEDFTRIEEHRITARDDRLIAWLPRGHRWVWHGRTWLACGGGVSLDKAIRTEGADWWPEEEITAGQEAEMIAAGRAGVMLAHDCPSGVGHVFPGRPAWWDPADVERSLRHEERLQRIVDAVQPAHIIHGHLHRGYRLTCDFGYGEVQVAGLNADGAGGNWGLLDTRTMQWQPS